MENGPVSRAPLARHGELRFHPHRPLRPRGACICGSRGPGAAGPGLLPLERRAEVPGYLQIPWAVPAVPLAMVFVTAPFVLLPRIGPNREVRGVPPALRRGRLCRRGVLPPPVLRVPGQPQPPRPAPFFRGGSSSPPGTARARRADPVRRDPHLWTPSSEPAWNGARARGEHPGAAGFVAMALADFVPFWLRFVRTSRHRPVQPGNLPPPRVPMGAGTPRANKRRLDPVEQPGQVGDVERPGGIPRPGAPVEGGALAGPRHGRTAAGGSGTARARATTPGEAQA